MESLRFLSLFSGAGIAEMGFKNTAHKVVLANELLKLRCDVHSQWHPKVDIVAGDITHTTVKEEIIHRSKQLKVNAIIATPPCQGFSLVGKNKNKGQMLSDERNHLIFSLFDIIDDITPNVVIIENVPRFLKFEIDDKNITDIIREKYGKKYIISVNVLNAKDYKVPQSRERAIIVMTKSPWEWRLPRKHKEITVRQAIGSLPSLESGENSTLKNHKSRVHTKKHVLWMKHTATGCSAIQNKKYYPVKDNGERIKSFGACYKRIEWDKPSPTITMRNDCISSQSNVHPGRKLPNGCYSDARVLTIRELLILMSINPDLTIPDFCSDIQIRGIVGEAVPPKLIYSILKGLHEKN